MSLFSLIFKYKDKKSPDRLGFYPEKLHVQAFPERRFLWTSRLLVICAAISICINIAIISTIYILIPQKNAKPIFYNIDKNDHKLNSIDALVKSVPYQDLMSEMYIYEYINLRHSIPRSAAELYYRWDH